MTINGWIPAAAAVTPVGLLAVTLLATPRQALPEADLLRQIDLYGALLRGFPYSRRVTIPEMSSAEIVAYGISMQMVTRQPHGLGDIVRMSDENAILATYYRNNILHLFAMPSLVALGELAKVPMREGRLVAGQCAPSAARRLGAGARLILG